MLEYTRKESVGSQGHTRKKHAGTPEKNMLGHPKKHVGTPEKTCWDTRKKHAGTPEKNMLGHPQKNVVHETHP